MKRSQISVVAVLALAGMNVSCGRSDGPPLYPVHGKVIYKGQPAVGAVVMLRRDGPPLPGTEALGPLVPTGEVDQDGNFSVVLEEFGTGAPVGSYKALVTWRVQVGGSPEVAEPVSTSKTKKARKKFAPDKPDGVPDRLEGRFMNPDRSTFVVEVKAEDNQLQPFDVSK